MIDINEWLDELSEEDKEYQDNETYQQSLFLSHVCRSDDFGQTRRDLLARYNAGEELFGPQGLRKELAAIDLAYFGRAYLPHYFIRESPEFHAELDNIWQCGVLKGKNPLQEHKTISRMDGSRQATAAPRGHAKSTNFTFKDTLHAILYQYKHYAIIISDSGDQAEGFLDDIKTELEGNYHIVQDFGELKGNKCWRTGVILTATNIKVEALGSGKKIRGRRHQNWRPDLLVLDDIENDENVETPDQRRKLKNWYDRAVSKCGDTYTDIMYIGTLLHYDSLLSNVLKNPRYKTKIYRAIISEAVNRALWEEWEQIYTNLFDEAHQENARSFYEDNEDAMLEGAEVLWSEKITYYGLMEMRIAEGEYAFNSEMQNDPIDPENADFLEEWFDWYEDGEVDFKSHNFVIIGANDPSLGKNKKADTSSIIDLALDISTGYMYVLGASVERRKPSAIIMDIIETHRRYLRDYKKGYYRFGVETVQFQYFFKDVLAAAVLESGDYIPIEEITASINKMVRIRSLQPYIKNKWIKFNCKHKELLKQMTEFPMGRNDDAPDGLQMAVALAQQIKKAAAPIKYDSIIRRFCRFGKGAW